MYSVVLLLAAASSTESTSFHLFRQRHCCPPPCRGSTAEQAPVAAPEPASGPTLSPVEEQHLSELLGLFKKAGKTPVEMHQYAEWYRGITPDLRAQEYKEMITPRQEKRDKSKAPSK